ncbi:MAG: hypothetical protein R3234_00875 [Thermoanaerobaculia bacterium]|nr:hypothetical protein [Thermoanaerobaculia bacterium]
MGRVWILASAALLLLPELARACAVCYGSAEGEMIDGARASVLFLLGLTYLLLGGGIGLVFVARRRTGAKQENEEGDDR